MQAPLTEVFRFVKLQITLLLGFSTLLFANFFCRFAFSSSPFVQFSRCNGRDCALRIKQCKRSAPRRSDLRDPPDWLPACLLRKEVIQPLVLERLPCYDFTPIIKPTFGRVPLAVRLRTSGVPDSHGVTGGVYKARERIHRGILIRDY